MLTSYNSKNLNLGEIQVPIAHDLSNLPLSAHFLYTSGYSGYSGYSSYFQLKTQASTHSKNEIAVFICNPSRDMNTRSEAEIPMDCDTQVPDLTGARLTTRLCNEVRWMNRYWAPYQLFPRPMQLLAWGQFPTKMKAIVNRRKSLPYVYLIDPSSHRLISYTSYP